MYKNKYFTFIYLRYIYKRTALNTVTDTDYNFTYVCWVNPEVMAVPETG